MASGSDGGGGGVANAGAGMSEPLSSDRAATITTILVELVAVRFECTKKSIGVGVGIGPCSVGHHNVSSPYFYSTVVQVKPTC